MTMDVTIYHNPDCGTSRNALAMIRNAGIEPTVVEYLKAPPNREQLAKMIADAGLTVRAFPPEGIRISVGEEESVEKLLAVAADVVRNLPNGHPGKRLG